MSELLTLAQRAVDRASGDEALEAFLTHARTFETRAYQGEVESVSSAEPRGLGVRVVIDHSAGFAYSTDLSDDGLTAVVAQARANARHATPDEAVGIAGEWDRPPAVMEGLVDSEQPGISAERKVAFVLELERATRSIDPRIRTVEDAVYSDAESMVAIATSTGVSSTYVRTDAWCYAVAIAEDGGDTEVGFDFGLARGLNGIDVTEVGRRSAHRALQVLGATKIPSARMPVVFDPYTAAQFLGVLGGALTGEAVQKGRSLFAGKLGEKVAGEITLLDDGTILGAPGSAPWDDEGVPTRRTDVISGGVLTSYLYDLTSARRDHTDSTGNAARAGFKSGPGPAPSNMALEPTGESRAELLERAGRALLVQDFHGVHSGVNPVSGDFSVGATGHLLEDGAPTIAVKEVTIAAPMLEILAGIVAVADDRRWVPFGGSFGGATTLVAEMTVAGG